MDIFAKFCDHPISRQIETPNVKTQKPFNFWVFWVSQNFFWYSAVTIGLKATVKFLGPSDDFDIGFVWIPPKTFQYYGEMYTLWPKSFPTSNKYR
jgi:hypothetical protein